MKYSKKGIFIILIEKIIRKNDNPARKTEHGRKQVKESNRLITEKKIKFYIRAV
ncbi:MAG: hypothetical protein CM15mV101_550 [uncultured marine virus]|nr:MAG: hypothetical protein CM15mV101_550 [uncultured marine virus]